MPSPPRLAALATAVPPHRLDQGNVVERVEQLFGRSPDFARLISVYANSGIKCRYSVMPLACSTRRMTGRTATAPILPARST